MKKDLTGIFLLGMIALCIGFFMWVSWPYWYMGLGVAVFCILMGAITAK